MSQNVKKMYILGYLGSPEPILLSSYPLIGQAADMQFLANPGQIATVFISA